jgi:autotransporter-associated beta strand protein
MNTANLIRTLPGLLFLFAFDASHAGTATWKMTPQDGNWNNVANWAPPTIPNGPNDTARFGFSNSTNVTISSDIEVASIVFMPGASAYTFLDDTSLGGSIIISGPGVTNSSGVLQNWDLNNDGSIDFENNSTAGTLTTYTAEGGSVAAGPGSILFENTSAAGAATLTANGGVVPGTIQFLGSSIGGLAQIVCNGGTLDISSHSAPGVTVGSIEGTSGSVLLGGNKLTVGGRNSSTSFTGVVSGTGGSLTKVGAGTLTLGGANTYTGATTVSAGGLLLQENGNSSQTGLGNVTVSAGSLGGNGTAAGTVTIGDGRGARGVLAPGFVDDTAGSGIFMPKKLTFRPDGDLVMRVNTDMLTADQVTAKGVTIQTGSTFALSDLGNTALQQPTTFVLINNTSQSPISGTFANIAEGQQIQIGPNIHTFTYHGGVNGNDFTDGALGFVP